MPLFPVLPENWAELSADEIQAFIDASVETARQIHADPDSFVTDERSRSDVLAEMRAGVAALNTARDELASREPEPEVEEPSDDDFAAVFAEAGDDDDHDGEEPEDEEPEAPAGTGTEVEVDVRVEPSAAAELEPVVAAAPARPVPRRRPARATSAVPTPVAEQAVPLVAAGAGFGPALGDEIDLLEVGEMMARAHHNFGRVPAGMHGERVPVARATWSDRYPANRKLGLDEGRNMALVAAALDPEQMKAEIRRRLTESLVAAGGLCAPVTPYYQLQVLAQAARPVRASLPSFNADRGGISFARPASIAAIETGIGIVTAAEDALGGTFAAKACQVIDCPAWSEVDIQAIYHCVQFGNMGARTFPELLAQWNQLVLAAQARVAETALLDGIGAASTAVTANNATDYGLVADLVAQIQTAAAALRSRHRMDPDAVLRVILPRWVLDAMQSDTLKTIDGSRFSMGPAAFIALLRQANVEPTFALDGETGAGQVFGTQGAAGLLEFPTTVVWYLFPEGSFLFIDGGSLELGLVRDSTLNADNSFQLFGETFENVAFVGVESLKVTSTVCDSGALAAGITPGCPSY